MQDYLSLVRAQDLDTLEAAWNQATSDPGDVDGYCKTVQELGRRGETGTALDLGERMMDALDERGRSADAVRLGTTLVLAQAHSDALARKLLALVQKAYATEAWFELAMEASRLGDGNISSSAFGAFDTARRFTPGHVVYHRAGWGEGVVEELDADGRTVVIRFRNGSVKDLPFQSALESLKPLDDDDLRTMRMIHGEELEQLAQEHPARVIRMAAKTYRGRINSTQLKSELAGSAVPAKRWASWWKRAKTAAANDPWLLIEGSSTRPVFELREVPVSLADEAGKALQHTHDLPSAIEVCRDYLGRGLDKDAQGTVLDLAQERVETELVKREETPAHLLDGILFLEEHGRKMTVAAADELREMLLIDDGFQPETFDNLRTQKSREHAVTCLPEALGDSWADRCVHAITRFPASVVEYVVDLLHEAQQSARLSTAWQDVAPYPKKHPILTLRLGKLFADGAFDEREDKPEAIAVNRVLLHLCRIIAKEPKSNVALQRIKARVTSVLLGRRGILPPCLDAVGRVDLAALLGIAERGGQDFPQEVTDAILRVVGRRFPDITNQPERPFWEDEDRIYVTAAGLARYREEHRVLVDEKIPANAEAIGNAASLGDLSENSEWDAAMEEQRKLTGRAEEMSRDLRKARLIEDQEVPDGVVAPGTQVSFTHLDDGSQVTFKILGPWGAFTEDILNYRAPLAKALLGRQVGDEAVVEEPDGQRQVRIDTIDKII